MKTLVFDMDGTIADLYNVSNWLEKLRKEDPSPYEDAEPLYDVKTLNTVIKTLKLQGWQIVITTWLSKNSSKEYDKKVIRAKKEWLKKYAFPYDNIFLVPYGTEKYSCTSIYGKYQILIDDNDEILASWAGIATIDSKTDILKALKNLIA